MQVGRTIGGAAGLAAIVLLSRTLLILFPLAIGVAFLASRRKRRLFWTWPVLLLVLFLATVNSLKWPESDLAGYYEYIDFVRHQSLTAVLFTEDAAFGSIRAPELIFKIYVWLLGSKVLFTFASSMIIYGAGALFGYEAMRRYASARRPAISVPGAAAPDAVTEALVVCAALLVGFTFSLTAHLTRQYLAGAVFFAGTYAYFLGIGRRWLLLPALSGLVHSSALLLLLPLGLAILHRRSPRGYFLAVAIIMGFGLSGWLEGYIGAAFLSSSLLREDGTLSVALIALDAAVVVAAAVACRATLARMDRVAGAVGMLLAFSGAFAALLFVVRNLPLVVFRNYFYLEFVRTPLLALLLWELLHRAGGLRKLLSVALVAASCLICWWRTTNTEWSYGDGEGAGMPLTVEGVVRRWDRISRLW